MRPVVYEPRTDAYFLSRPNFTDGTVSMGDSFSTIFAPRKRMRPGFLLEVKNGKVNAFTKNSYTAKYFIVESSQEMDISLPISYYPGWTVFSDGKNVPIRYQNDGTLRFTVSPGIRRVSVLFRETGIRLAGDLVSFISIFYLFYRTFFKRKAVV
jgi:uncharacterized membrane protein YfhO